MLCKTGSSWASAPTGLRVRTDTYEMLESVSSQQHWLKVTVVKQSLALFLFSRLMWDLSSQHPPVRKALTSPCLNTGRVEAAAQTDSLPFFFSFLTPPPLPPLPACLWSLCVVCFGQGPVFDRIIIPTARSNLHMHTACGSKGSWVRKGQRGSASVPRPPTAHRGAAQCCRNLQDEPWIKHNHRRKALRRLFISTLNHGHVWWSLYAYASVRD